MKTNLVKFLALAVLMCSAGCSTATSNNSSSAKPTPSSSSTKIEDPKSYWSEVYTNPTSVVNASGQPYRVEIADPSVVRGDNGYLYCVSTDRRFLRSEDGCNWEVIDESIIDLPSWGKEFSKAGAGYNLWAPDLIKIGDKWIYYYSLSGWDNPIGIGYAIADDVEGPYVDQGKLFAGSEMGILNTIWAFILPAILAVGINGPIFILIFYQFFRQVPKVLIEAAQIDGAGYLKSFLYQYDTVK